jgi:hypothetical protein
LAAAFLLDAVLDTVTGAGDFDAFVAALATPLPFATDFCAGAATPDLGALLAVDLVGTVFAAAFVCEALLAAGALPAAGALLTGTVRFVAGTCLVAACFVVEEVDVACPLPSWPQNKTAATMARLRTVNNLVRRTRSTQ